MLKKTRRVGPGLYHREGDSYFTERPYHPILLIMVWTAFIVALLLVCGIAVAATEFRMVTASERGTYHRICLDAAEIVATPAGLTLGCEPSAGSAENVKLLRYKQGVKLAAVQGDVFQAYLDMAAAGDREAANIIRPLRVILPLYDEEIYLFVRADSPLNFIHEIRGARMSVGLIGSGTALSLSTLYRLMYGEALPDGTAFLSNEDGLLRLLTEKSIDVVAIIAGQPAKVIADIKPEAKQHLRMLRFDPIHAASKEALKTYSPATVRKISYPNLLDNDIPSLAVKALLVTYDFGYGNVRQKPSADNLVRLTRSLCTQLGVLQDQGHSKWRDVELAMPPLGQGWLYYEPTARELAACTNRPAVIAPVVPAAVLPARCSQQRQILGLC